MAGPSVPRLQISYEGNRGGSRVPSATCHSHSRQLGVWKSLEGVLRERGMAWEDLGE